jgi:hypothetical protein
MRSEALPELPTIGDFLPGYEATFIVLLKVMQTSKMQGTRSR